MKKILLLSILLTLANTFLFSQSEYPTLGRTVIDSTLYVRDSVHVKGRMLVEDRLLLMNGIRVYENARFESNARFLGVSRFDGNAIFKGNVRLDSIGNVPNAILNAGTMEFLVVLPNGQMKKGSIEDFQEILKSGIYAENLPFELPCDELYPTGIVNNPVWKNGVNKIYVDYCNFVNVGIGTNSPTQKLDVRGVTYTTRLKVGLPGIEQYGAITVFRPSAGSENLVVLGRMLGTTPEILFEITNSGAITFENKGNQTTLDITNGTGKAIVIKKADGSKILQLEGDGLLRARRVRVDADEWADYVFKPGYGLMALKEVEKHIKERGHLPGVPSEKEIKQNGIDIAEMQKIQMEKIEEVFLHIIELEKKVEELENKVSSLEKENKNLKR